MSDTSRWDIRLGPKQLRRRTFMLGNKQALTLSLPAAAGCSPALSHPHKWFGAYSYGRKALEGQTVRAGDPNGPLLCARNQTGFTMTLTCARREFEVEGERYSEAYFVPDAMDGFACELAGPALVVEPAFDLRFYRALNVSFQGYTIEEVAHGAVVSNVLPAGRYDDLTETFIADETSGDEQRLFVAVQAVGDGAEVEVLPIGQRARRRIFRKDQQRRRLVAHSAFAGEDGDHAPLWTRSVSSVYAPVRIHLHRQGVVVYGVGSSREEALEAAGTIAGNLTGFEVQKVEQAEAILEHARLETGNERTDRAYAQVLTRLTDTLVARQAKAPDTQLERPSTMILAGNQYFHDSWKRDENIALGFLLALGFYDLARDVIADTWRLQDERTGRLPQRIRAGEDLPYHSSDGTLWALLRLEQYRRYSGDEYLLREKLPMVVKYFERSLERTVGGLLPSGRTVEESYLWETWMDTPHTPRDGFPVEIQMLWLACLRAFRPLLATEAPALELRMAATEADAWRELQRFFVSGIPVDSLDRELQARDLLTPNPYFCFGLGLDLGAEVEGAMRRAGREQLAGRHGIVTLAPRDWQHVFPAEFLGDRRHVRGRRMRSTGKFNYHRGVEWNWLSQFFVRAELKYGEADVAYRRFLRNQVTSALDRGGIGGISELFDLTGTRGPEFQAWSMSGFLEALHAFAGVEIDVPGRRIVVAPQLPRDWPGLALRKWYGRIPFDLTVRREARGTRVRLEFPWGEAPDAEMELALMLPEGSEPRYVEVWHDGRPNLPAWDVEPVPGIGRRRMRVSMPAARCIEVEVAIRRAARGVARSA